MEKREQFAIALRQTKRRQLREAKREQMAPIRVHDAASVGTEAGNDKHNLRILYANVRSVQSRKKQDLFIQTLNSIE